MGELCKVGCGFGLSAVCVVVFAHPIANNRAHSSEMISLNIFIFVPLIFNARIVA